MRPLLLLVLILFSYKNYGQMVLPASIKAELELKATRISETGLQSLIYLLENR